LLLAGALSLGRAADDTNTFAVLECKNESFTNARISSVTQAYAIIFYDGGGKKVPLSELPKSLQQRYGYDPDKAAQFMAAEKEKKEAAAQAFAQQMAMARSTQGERQKVRVLKVMDSFIGDTKCEIAAEGGQQEVLMSGGDLSTIQQYYAQLETLQSQAASAQGAAASTQPVRYSRNRAARAAAQQQQHNNAANAKALAGQLKALKAQGTNITSIYAAPTSQKYANLPIWIYLGKAVP